jgi:hypothetical protein
MVHSWNLDTTGDVGRFDEVALAPGEVTTWWYEWGFDEQHWQRMSFVPLIIGERPPLGEDRRGGMVTIVSESFENYDENRGREGFRRRCRLWVRLRNDSPWVITVKPIVFVAPRRPGFR